MTLFEVGSLPDMGTLGTQIVKTASECLARYRLQSRGGKTLTLHFRIYQPGNSITQQPLHVLSEVARDTPFTKLLAQMHGKFHLPVNGSNNGAFGDTRGHGDFIAIYRAHQVEPTATPATLAMPTGSLVYVVARKWWDLTRRTEARRGLLSSQRPQDALVKSLVSATESKVRKELLAAGVAVANAAHSGKGSPVRTRVNHNLTGSTSNNSLLTASSSSIGQAKSPTRLPAAQEEDSLSVLLRERAAARREKERRALSNDNNNSSSSNNSSEDPPTGGFPIAQLAANSQQPLDTLDETWVQFAALTTSVRVATERLAQWAHDAAVVQETPKLSSQQLQSLEDEWQKRAHATEELVSQTRAAHRLATRMLGQVRSRRAPPKGAREHDLPDEIH